MSRVNEGGMHYVTYHRRDTEFDTDNAFAPKNKLQHSPKIEHKEIIIYKGKKYEVVSQDKDGNKIVIPYQYNKRKNKSKNKH